MSNYAETEKKQIYKKWWFWLIIVVIIVAISTSQESNSNTLTSTQGENQGIENKEKDNIPTEYKNALKKAETYSKTMNMSKQGIYDQLTSEYGEQFPEDAAQYAIDNLNVDYKQNALEKAKTYQNTMNMSKNAIYDQLVSEYGEKFTKEEAQYAIDNLK